MNTEQIQGQQNFLDHIIETQHLKNDAALARFLKVAPPTISKQRTGSLKVCAGSILRAHEATDIPVATFRKLLAGGV